MKNNSGYTTKQIVRKRNCFGDFLMIIGMVFGIIMFSLIFDSESYAWWNEQWQYQKKICLNTTAVGAHIKENLSDPTLLLRLHSGNFNFSNAKENGADIRFVAGDDATVLKHHIEDFDALDEIALI